MKSPNLGAGSIPHNKIGVKNKERKAGGSCRLLRAAPGAGESPRRGGLILHPPAPAAGPQHPAGHSRGVLHAGMLSLTLPPARHRLGTAVWFSEKLLFSAPNRRFPLVSGSANVWVHVRETEARSHEAHGGLDSPLLAWLSLVLQLCSTPVCGWLGWGELITHPINPGTHTRAALVLVGSQGAMGCVLGPLSAASRGAAGPGAPCPVEQSRER